MPLFLQQCSDCKCNILHHPATPSWNHQLTTKLGLALSGAMELGEPLPAMYTMWEIQISSKLGGLPDSIHCWGEWCHHARHLSLSFNCWGHTKASLWKLKFPKPPCIDALPSSLLECVASTVPAACQGAKSTVNVYSKKQAITFLWFHFQGTVELCFIWVCSLF